MSAAPSRFDVLVRMEGDLASLVPQLVEADGQAWLLGERGKAFLRTADGKCFASRLTDGGTVLKPLLAPRFVAPARPGYGEPMSAPHGRAPVRPASGLFYGDTAERAYLPPVPGCRDCD